MVGALSAGEGVDWPCRQRRWEGAPEHGLTALARVLGRDGEHSQAPGGVEVGVARGVVGEALPEEVYGRLGEVDGGLAPLGEFGGDARGCAPAERVEHEVAPVGVRPDEAVEERERTAARKSRRPARSAYSERGKASAGPAGGDVGKVLARTGLPCLRASAVLRAISHTHPVA